MRNNRPAGRLLQLHRLTIIHWKRTAEHNVRRMLRGNQYIIVIIVCLVPGNLCNFQKKEREKMNKQWMIDEGQSDVISSLLSFVWKSCVLSLLTQMSDIYIRNMYYTIYYTFYY